MRSALLAVALAPVPVSCVAAETVHLYAAGSLKAVMTDITREFEAKSGGAVKVETVFGPSGLLRERIEKGEAAHVFASADTGHPRRLGDQGRTAGPMVVFARNELCALLRGGLVVATGTLLERMLNPAMKLGTSTPKADPSGDFAFALFAKAEAVRRAPRRHWSQGANIDGRSGLGERASRPESLCMGDGERQSRHFPHNIAPMPCWRTPRFPRFRSSRFPIRLMSARITASSS